jgi:PBS lyase HEAT-like repeat
MRLDELEELIVQEPAEAHAAIEELVSTSNVEALAHIAKSARAAQLAESAIEGLGEIGGDEAIAVLVELLEEANTPFVIGGTEQERKREDRQEALVQSVARARRVAPPAGRSQEEIAEFIEESRRS